MPMLHRKTGDLRTGRISIPGATYFVPACTAGRKTKFVDNEAANCARTILERMVRDRDFRWLAATVMPDHLHLLFELGDRLSFVESLAKIKGLITRTLRPAAALWQENAFEHRLREGDDVEAYAFYVFMNPYRADLRSSNEAWPWWICTEPKRFRFLDGLRASGAPPAEWLARDDSAGGSIVVGE